MSAMEFKKHTALPHHFFVEMLRPRSQIVLGRIDAAVIGKHAVVRKIHVDSDYRGRGYGARLWLAAAQAACADYGVPLASDDIRTPAAEAFWTKQVRKRRARCIDASGGGKMDPETGAVKTKGGWTCRRYTLKCPAPRSLGNGAKRNG